MATAKGRIGMNGSLKWLVGAMFTILMAVLAYAVNGNDKKIDTVKADTTAAIESHKNIKGHAGMVEAFDALMAQRRVDSTVTSHWRKDADSSQAKTARTVDAIARSLGVQP